MTVGQKFRHACTGVVVKVRAVESSRSLVLNMDTGEREWVQNEELRTAFKPCVPMGAQRERAI